MEVIDNLIKIIKKHQEGLPNVEPLEVDSEFEKVLHDTDDGKLDIKNEMYYCTGPVSYTHLTLPTTVRV